MVNWASRLGANLAKFAFVDTVRNDGLGGVFARLELRPFRFLRRVGLTLPNFDVLVAGMAFSPSGCCLYAVLIWTSSGLAATLALTCASSLAA
jgi:hypothetical protein